MPAGSRVHQAGATTEGGPKEAARRGSLADQLRYRFDLALSRGPLVVIGYLGVVMLLIILLATLILFALRISGVNGEGHLGFTEAFWQSLFRVIDSGTVMSRVDANWFKFAIGVLIVVAVIANMWLARRARAIKVETGA